MNTVTSSSHPDTAVSSAVGACSCTVLVCEDQKVLRDAINSVLAASPRFHVVLPPATDGTGCVQRVAETHPDLLILDVNMPGGGPHVIHAIRAIDPDVYILVFSGWEDATIQCQMIAAGADHYLIKTGRLRPLLEALNNAYDQRSNPPH